MEKIYSVTSLTGGLQALIGHNLDLLSAIELANDCARGHIEHSEHTKKAHYVSMNKVSKGDVLAPEKAIFEVSVRFPTVKNATKTFWIVEN